MILLGSIDWENIVPATITQIHPHPGSAQDCGVTSVPLRQRDKIAKDKQSHCPFKLTLRPATLSQPYFLASFCLSNYVLLGDQLVCDP